MAGLLQTLVIALLLADKAAALKSVKVQRRSSAGPASVEKAGHKIYYDPQTSNANFWRSTYTNWEGNTFKVFQRFIGPETVVLDIGSWIGVTALWEGQIAKSVVALEPTPKAFAELKANLAMNPELAGRVKIINKAMGSDDGRKEMTNRGDSMDRLTSFIEVPVISVNTLVAAHPELQNVGFVKIDTEGYEKVIVPALEQFLKEKKPVAFVSLHQTFIGHAEVQSVVDKLADTFPYLYEIDMKTPFNRNRKAYTDGDHGGVDVICTWAPLH